MKVWFTEKRNNDVAIDSRVFKVQAMKFAKELGEDKFNGSDGFVSRWKNRYNVVHWAISGEANSVDLDTVEAFKPIILDLLKEYLPKDVFNLDEAGLQYGVTAKKTLAYAYILSQTIFVQDICKHSISVWHYTFIITRIFFNVIKGPC